MSINYSFSNLRNEIYVYDKDKLLFFLQGSEMDIDFTSMSKCEIHNFIINYTDNVDLEVL